MDDDLKLLSTVAAKVSEETARRIRAIALHAGMSDGQLARMILDRAMELFKDWDPSINPRYFLEQLQVRPEQLNLFFLRRDGLERLARFSGSGAGEELGSAEACERTKPKKSQI